MSQGIVADGHERACKALEPQVREEVEREFADRLANASFLQRQRLQVEMESEIWLRVREKAPPPDALY